MARPTSSVRQFINQPHSNRIQKQAIFYDLLPTIYRMRRHFLLFFVWPRTPDPRRSPSGEWRGTPFRGDDYRNGEIQINGAEMNQLFASANAGCRAAERMVKLNRNVGWLRKLCGRVAEIVPAVVAQILDPIHSTTLLLARQHGELSAA